MGLILTNYEKYFHVACGVKHFANITNNAVSETAAPLVCAGVYVCMSYVSRTTCTFGVQCMQLYICVCMCPFIYGNCVCASVSFFVQHSYAAHCFRLNCS